MFCIKCYQWLLIMFLSKTILDFQTKIFKKIQQNSNFQKKNSKKISKKLSKKKLQNSDFLIFFKPLVIVYIWPSYNNSLSFPFPVARGRTGRRRMSRSAILSHFGQIRAFLFQCSNEYAHFHSCWQEPFLEAQHLCFREFLKHWARRAHAGALESLVLHFNFARARAQLIAISNRVLSSLKQPQKPLSSQNTAQFAFEEFNFRFKFFLFLQKNGKIRQFFVFEYFIFKFSYIFWGKIWLFKLAFS